MSIEELVKSAKSGDDNAFCELMKVNKDTLYKTAYVYTKNKHDSLEILDQTVYKAYISIKNIKEDKYFNTWLMRILINNCINYLNHKKRLSFFGINLDTLGKKDKDTTDLEDKLDLYKAIDKLEEKLKIVIILRYFNDLTVLQIANILECPIGTVKTHIHKAVKKLKIEMGV
ncbi:sigma-70 family RNA polymerase sigma factor [Clostridium lundense]|uniref:sigma-70 family RNA polymerase sigma factor n=1 Tax=Clostridium lundense TaxID=319475 RepID=UPI000488B894|nr:sigma-70 family RNA polymerase sigma factor [Clostridium lundense]